MRIKAKNAIYYARRRSFLQHSIGGIGLTAAAAPPGARKRNMAKHRRLPRTGRWQDLVTLVPPIWIGNSVRADTSPDLT